MMRIPSFVLLAVVAATPAFAQELVVEEVASVATLAPDKPPSQAIAFSDNHQNRLADPVSGLLRFADWAQAKPVQKQFLGLYPAYDERSVTLAGKARKKRMHVYVAEARFQLKKPPQAIDLARYVSLSLIEKLDPAIKHRTITQDEVIPFKNAQFANNIDPQRRWCAKDAGVICIQSYYKLEGKLPAGVQLVNKLREGGRKIADFIDFQSELRAVPPAEIDAAGLAKLTGLDAPVVGVIEQSIFYANQVVQFGKLLVVFQPHPGTADRTIVSAFMALGVESDLLEKKKEYGKVPVLRNLIPAQLLSGNSSFNTGNSISAGLPKYARNSIRAIAGLLAKE